MLVYHHLNPRAFVGTHRGLGIPTRTQLTIGIYQMPAALTGITTPLTWQQYPHLIGVGPLWFVEMLLIFDVGYAAWRAG